jgi:hypothetical protein
MRHFHYLVIGVFLALSCFVPVAGAAIIYESGTLGPTGVPRGTIPGANVSATVFNGVRFELTAPVRTSQIGGHFVGSIGTTDTFFGAIVSLSDSNDFPDSGNLSTPDVLGSTIVAFPEPSAEVFGNLELTLNPGWYSLIFGSGLFGSSGDGAMPLNNPDIGTPSYIGYQPGAGFGWGNLLNPIFRNYRFVVEGNVIPEPSTIIMAFSVSSISLLWRSRKH